MLVKGLNPRTGPVFVVLKAPLVKRRRIPGGGVRGATRQVLPQLLAANGRCRPGASYRRRPPPIAYKIVFDLNASLMGGTLMGRQICRPYLGRGQPFRGSADVLVEHRILARVGNDPVGMPIIGGTT